jgi:hypothetical protein
VWIENLRPRGLDDRRENTRKRLTLTPIQEVACVPNGRATPRMVRKLCIGQSRPCRLRCHQPVQNVMNVSSPQHPASWTPIRTAKPSLPSSGRAPFFIAMAAASGACLNARMRRSGSMPSLASRTPSCFLKMPRCVRATAGLPRRLAAAGYSLRLPCPASFRRWYTGVIAIIAILAGLAFSTPRLRSWRSRDFRPAPH